MSCNNSSSCGGPDINTLKQISERAAYWARQAQLAALGATGAGTDSIFWLNGQTVNTSYTIPVSQNAGSFGPITIASGVTVTVPSGGVWTVV